jgi:hypothetical protein
MFRYADSVRRFNLGQVPVLNNLPCLGGCRSGGLGTQPVALHSYTRAGCDSGSLCFSQRRLADAKRRHIRRQEYLGPGPFNRSLFELNFSRFVPGPT